MKRCAQWHNDIRDQVKCEFAVNPTLSVTSLAERYFVSVKQVCSWLGLPDPTEVAGNLTNVTINLNQMQSKLTPTVTFVCFE